LYRLGKCTKSNRNIVEVKMYAYSISERATLVSGIQILKIN